MSEYSATLPPTFSMIASALMIAAFLLWPTKRPYVTLKGSTIHERILIFRAPAYWSRSWYIRWTPSDGIFARAYCYDPERSAAFRRAMEISP